MQRIFKKFSKLNNFLHGDSRLYFNLFEGDPQLCCCFFFSAVNLNTSYRVLKKTKLYKNVSASEMM